MDILKLNSISKLANPVLEGYNLTDNSQNPVGILVRSFKMDEYEVPSSLLAVARAGAGVNNIPHAEYAKKGICAFNTPGANANAVKELVIAALIIGARNIVIRLSLSFSIVREAIIPVTAHPQETVSGNNDFPDRPNFRNTLSRINATRAA